MTRRKDAEPSFYSGSRGETEEKVIGDAFEMLPNN